MTQATVRPMQPWRNAVGFRRHTSARPKATIILDDDLFAAVQRFAEADGVSFSASARRLIRESAIRRLRNLASEGEL